MSFVRCLKNQLATGYRPLYICHKLMCIYYDLGSKRNQKFMFSLYSPEVFLIDFDWDLLPWDESLKLIYDLSQFSCPKNIAYLVRESQNLDWMSSSLFLTMFLWQVDF